MKLENGTHIATLHSKNDPNKPIARLALKPYKSPEGHTVLRGHKVYGMAGEHHAAFVGTVKAWTRKHFPLIHNKYEMPASVYSDGVPIRLGKGHSASTYLDHESDEVRAGAFKSTEVTRKDIETGLNDSSPKVIEAALKHPLAKSKDADKFVKHADNYVRAAAFAKCSKGTITDIIKKGHSQLHILFQNRNLTRDHLDSMLQKPNVSEDFRLAAIAHPKVDPKLYKGIINDPQAKRDEYHAATMNPKLSSDDIHKAIDHPHFDTATAAFLYNHDAFNSNHISRLMQNWKLGSTQKLKILQHPSATQEHADEFERQQAGKEHALSLEGTRFYKPPGLLKKLSNILRKKS